LACFVHDGVEVRGPAPATRKRHELAFHSDPSAGRPTAWVQPHRLLARMGEPKLWVHSAQHLGKLIDENWPLLQEIRRRPPRSMSELAGRTGRSLSNLSRTLKIFGALRAGIDRVR
jgi:hypothetical protein